MAANNPLDFALSTCLRLSSYFCCTDAFPVIVPSNLCA